MNSSAIAMNFLDAAKYRDIMFKLKDRLKELNQLFPKIKGNPSSPAPTTTTLLLGDEAS